MPVGSDIALSITTLSFFTQLLWLFRCNSLPCEAAIVQHAAPLGPPIGAARSLRAAHTQGLQETTVTDLFAGMDIPPPPHGPAKLPNGHINPLAMSQISGLFNTGSIDVNILNPDGTTSYSVDGTGTVIAMNVRRALLLTSLHLLCRPVAARVPGPVVHGVATWRNESFLVCPALQMIAEGHFTGGFSFKSIEAVKLKHLYRLNFFLAVGPKQSQGRYEVQKVHFPTELLQSNIFRWHDIQLADGTPSKLYGALLHELLKAGLEAILVSTTRECGGVPMKLSQSMYAFASQPDCLPNTTTPDPDYSYFNMVGVPGKPEWSACRSEDGKRHVIAGSVFGGHGHALKYRNSTNREAHLPLSNPSSSRRPFAAITDCYGIHGMSGAPLILAEGGRNARVDPFSNMRNPYVYNHQGHECPVIVGILTGGIFDPSGEVAYDVATMLSDPTLEYIRECLICEGFEGVVVWKQLTGTWPACCTHGGVLASLLYHACARFCLLASVCVCVHVC